MNAGITLIGILATLAAHPTEAMAPSSGRFQFRGSYYFFNSASNQYCALAGVPATAASLSVVDPQQMDALNVGMCNRATVPVASFQFHGNYYSNSQTHNHYCLRATAPHETDSLLVLNPQYLHALNTGMCEGTAAPAGPFQYNGIYYYNNPAANQYCTQATAPWNAGGLPFINPHFVRTENSGNCDSGTESRMAYTGYNLGSGFAVSTDANWQTFNKGYFPSRNIFVDAQLGSDNNPGTATLPLRTISAAQLAVRNIPASNAPPIQVNLRGTFYLQQPLRFSSADSGQGSSFVVYRNWPGYSATISGGKPISSSGWALYDSVKGIYRAPIGAMSFRNLFVNNQRAHIAKSPFPLTSSIMSSASGHIDCSRCMKPLPRKKTKVEIVTISMYEVSFCPGQLNINGSITNDDLSTDIDSTSWCWSHMLLLPELPTPPHVTWLQNSPIFLNRPGDWALDTAERYVYYIPLDGEDLGRSNVVVPQLTQLLHATSLRNVAFIGITFTHTDWQGANTKSGYLTMQADELYVSGASPAVEIPAAVAFDGGQHIIVAESKFEHLGTAGLFIGSGSSENLIFHNSFSDISASAIQIAGIMNQAATRTIATSNTTIQDNSISYIGQEYFGSPAIFQGYASYSLIDHNQIHDIPYSGISDGWGWTTSTFNNLASSVTANLIYNGMQVLQDGGGIYMNSAQPDTVIGQNLIRDLATGLPGVHRRVMAIGIYLDNGSSGISVTSNAVQNIPLSSVGVQPCGVFQNVPSPPPNKPAANLVTCNTPANAIKPLAGPRPIQPPS